MNIDEAVSDCFLHATGKASAPPTSKRAQIIGLLNYYQRRWGRQVGIDWNSLYDPAFSIGNITNTDTFDLDTSSIRKLSDRQGDFVRIVWSDGVGYSDYNIIDANKLKDYSYGVNKESQLGWYCAQIGSTLVFNHKFISTDGQFGGEIFVPVYTFPEPITDDSPTDDEVQVDDPDWLTVRAAAAYVRNDITRRQRWQELLDEADEIMDRMRDDNESQIEVVEKHWTPFSGLHGNNGLGNDDAWK